MMVLTAALSNMKLDWVDGLKWETVSNITLPPGKAIDRTTHANIGSWRAHMDAISTSVLSFLCLMLELLVLSLIRLIALSSETYQLLLFLRTMQIGMCG